jgi:hypothetical protein
MSLVAGPDSTAEAPHSKRSTVKQRREKLGRTGQCSAEEIRGAPDGVVALDDGLDLFLRNDAQPVTKSLHAGSKSNGTQQKRQRTSMFLSSMVFCEMSNCICERTFDSGSRHSQQVSGANSDTAKDRRHRQPGGSGHSEQQPDSSGATLTAAMQPLTTWKLCVRLRSSACAPESRMRLPAHRQRTHSESNVLSTRSAAVPLFLTAQAVSRQRDVLRNEILRDPLRVQIAHCTQIRKSKARRTARTTSKTTFVVDDALSPKRA